MQKEIYQTDKEFNSNIQKWGCYFFDLIYIALKHAKKLDNFTHDLIKEIYEKAIVNKKGKTMGEDCTVYSPDNIFDLVFEQIDKKNSRLKYEGIHTWYFEKDDKYKYIIGEWSYYNKRYKKRYSHFVVMDGNGKTKNNIEYNSLRSSHCVDYGCLKGCRRFEIIK